MDETAQRLVLDRGEAGVVVEYIAGEPLKMRQWTGYTPEPDHRYLASIRSPGIPPQWHVEAASAAPAPGAFTLTVMRPYRRGQGPTAAAAVERGASDLTVRLPGVTLRFPKEGADFAVARRGEREWRVSR